MLSFERKFFDWVQRHTVVLFFVFATIIGILLHTSGMYSNSKDMNSYLLPWWNEISASGVEVLGRQVGNYNIPYQFLIFIMSRVINDPLFAYKMLSYIFDFMLAGSAALLAYEISKNRMVSAVVYALTLCSFNCWLNSCFWGQCDSMYSTFVILAIYLLFKNKNIASFVMLGVALALKLQVIFILPVFFYYYLTERKYSIFHFLIIPAVNTLLCLPAVFFGRNFTDIFTLYFSQADTYHQIHMNYPNIYAMMFTGNNTIHFASFRDATLFMTAIVMIIGLVFVFRYKPDFAKKECFLMGAIWGSYALLMFMPGMHERYSYVMDILLIIYAVTQRKLIWVAVACNILTLRNYCTFLFEYEAIDIKIAALINIAIFTYVTYRFAKEIVANYATKTSEPEKIEKKSKKKKPQKAKAK